MRVITYDAILEGHQATEENAIDYARDMVWSEVEISPEQTIACVEHIATIDGTEVYYDYCGDYYFFGPGDE